MQYVAVNSHICAHSYHEKVIFNTSRISGVGVTHFMRLPSSCWHKEKSSL